MLGLTPLSNFATDLGQILKYNKMCGRENETEYFVRDLVLFHHKIIKRIDML